LAADTAAGISVIIYCYNHEEYVGECIESILAQTLQPLEIVICDDHSTDSSWTIIGDYHSRHPDLIVPHRHSKNIGMHYNVNFGLQRARGDLISSLGGDDRWLPQKLELEYEALQREPEARIAYSNVITIDAQGNRTGAFHDSGGGPPPSGDVFTEVFSRRFFNNSDSVFRNPLVYRSALDEVGNYDVDVPIHIDWDIKIRLTERFPVACANEVLVEYRIHEEGIHTSPPDLHYKSILYIYEKHLPLLEQRTIEESVRVKCNIESQLALLQSLIPTKEEPAEYSAGSVYERNRTLLDRLPAHDRTALGRELATELVSLALLAAKREIRRGRIKPSFMFLAELFRHAPKYLDLRYIASLMLPRWVRDPLKAAYRHLRRARP